MTYLQFADGAAAVLIEVAPQEVPKNPGVVKAGIAEKLSDGVLAAQSTLHTAVVAIIEGSAGAFVCAVREMQDPPDEMQLEFSIKATLEAGNFAIGKLSGDSNFAVTMTWNKASP